MAATHAQQFANATLVRAVFADPLAFVLALGGADGAAQLAALWTEAGAEVPPIARVADATFEARVARRGMYVIAVITLPPPRATGDAVMVAVVGRGDGATKLSTVAYYALEVELGRGAPRCHLVARSRLGEPEATWADGPLPDPSWFADDVFELYSGHTPSAHAGLPEVPGWYWWFTYDGAEAMRVLGAARTDDDAFDAAREAPILLLPETLACAEHYGVTAAKRLGEMRPYFRKSTSLAPAWQALVERLAGTAIPFHVARSLGVIAEAAEYGAFTKPQALELEAIVRARLAALGVDPNDNYEKSAQLNAAAREAEAPKVAPGKSPAFATEDPVWQPLFLAETDLKDHTRVMFDDAGSTEPTFAAAGGVRAGQALWVSDEGSATAQLADTRWVFRSASSAEQFLRTMLAAIARGLPPTIAPRVGDEVYAFGTDVAPRAQTVVVRVGRVIACVQVSEGPLAAASRQILHSATLHPFAAKLAHRARHGIAAYWLEVASPTNAVAALVHSPGYDAARLLEKYPMLAHAELPAAIATQGESYEPVARALASFQAQLRAHRFVAYRDAMYGLVRQLLGSDMGDPRVNVAHALEIVCELRYLDNDPMWPRLEAECRARG